MSTILVIEDQATIRENIKELLEQKNLIAKTAISAAEGYAIAKSLQPDLILCDLLLPDYSGIEFTKKIKKDQKLKNIPIIIITGENQQETYRKAMTQGADDFIVKPFKAVDLFNAIDAQLSKATVRQLDYMLIAELSEHSPLPIVRVDKNGKIIYSNPAAKPFEAKENLHEILKFVLKNDHENFEFQIAIGDRIFKCVATFNAAQQYHNLYFIDSTQQLNSLRELVEKNSLIERKNQNLSQFTYIVAHDLRAPVINLRQLLDLLLQEAKQKVKNNEKQLILLELLNSSLEKLETVMQDVSTILKTRESTAKQTSTMFSVYQFVQAALSEFSEQLKEISALVTIKISKGLQVNFPKKEFGIILFNLLENSLKFRDPDRQLTIDISATEYEEDLILEIKDNGIGFDEKIAKRKIMTFYQKMHDHIDGKGLGLQIIRNIIESNNGDISFTSQPGIGSTFRLKFKK